MAASASSPSARFVITGPTGWIGRALLDLLHRAGDPDALAAGDSVALFGSRSGTFALTGGKALSIRPLAEIGPEDVAGAHVVHLAFLTKDKLGEMGTGEFARTNAAIDDAVGHAIAAAAPASLFIASSGAARQAETGVEVNAYGLAKLEQERRFLRFSEDTGVPVLCGRIFNLAGPHINKLQDYAISNFAVQALAGDDIAIGAGQPVFRSFLHVDDLCRMIVRAARESFGQQRPVDLCGMEVLELQDIAARVANRIGKRSKFVRPDVTFSSKSEYVGNAVESRLLAMKLALPLKDFAEQLRDTVDWIVANDERPVVEKAGELEESCRHAVASKEI